MGDGFGEVFYTSREGLKLCARVYAPATAAGLPVVCLPGLTRNARDFHPLALMLSRHERRPRRVIAFDYRGRGRSARDRNWRNYAVETEAEDVLAGLTLLNVGRAHFIGTSYGGLIVVALAAMRPALIEAAVLNDIGPAIEGAGVAHIRSYLESAPRPASLAEAVALQKRASGQAFPALTEADWERMTLAGHRLEDGRPVADFDPRLVRTLKAIDLSRPLPDLWPLFMGLGRVPVLTIRGANSNLLARETLAEMARRHRRLEAVTAEGQGHAPLLETGALPRRIAGFLIRAERARG